MALLALAAFTAAFRPDLPRLREFVDYEAEFAPLMQSLARSVQRRGVVHAEVVSLPFWKLQFDTGPIWEVVFRDPIEHVGGDVRRAAPASLRRHARGGLVPDLYDRCHGSRAEARRFVAEVAAANPRAVRGGQREIDTALLEELYRTVVEEAASRAPRERHVREHTLLQERLVRLGAACGLQSYLPPGDRHRRCTSGSLGELPGATSQLPAQCASLSVRYLREVDVLWSDPQTGAVVAIFEVEHSTSISSGFLRMTDVLTAIPSFAVPGIVVVPDRRLNVALHHLRRPTFAAALRAAHGRLGVTTYAAVPDLADELPRAADDLERVLQVRWG